MTRRKLLLSSTGLACVLPSVAYGEICTFGEDSDIEAFGRTAGVPVAGLVVGTVAGGAVAIALGPAVVPVAVAAGTAYGLKKGYDYVSGKLAERLNAFSAE